MKKILFSLTLLAFSTSSAYADTKADAADEKEQLKQYDVEIIIFEDAHARYIDSEAWPHAKSEGIQNTDVNEPEQNLFKNISSSSDDHTVTELAPGQLSKQYNSLKRSSEFNVLFRSAWRQRGLSEGEAFDIDLSNLKNRHNNSSGNHIEGSLRVVLARYLHFYTDLVYVRESANSSVTSQTSDTKGAPDNTTEKINGQQSSENKTAQADSVDNRFTVKSHRKMRSKELHYIDHPLVGILVRIDPVEIKIEKQDNEEDSKGEVTPTEPR